MPSKNSSDSVMTLRTQSSLLRNRKKKQNGVCSKTQREYWEETACTRQNPSFVRTDNKPLCGKHHFDSFDGKTDQPQHENKQPVQPGTNRSAPNATQQRWPPPYRGPGAQHDTQSRQQPQLSSTPNTVQRLATVSPDLNPLLREHQSAPEHTRVHNSPRACLETPPP